MADHHGGRPEYSYKMVTEKMNEKVKSVSK